MRRTAGLLAAVMATACSHAIPGTARQESYALPADFPDVAGYTAIGEEAPFWHAEGKSIGWYFAGPRNLDCSVELFGYADSGRVRCKGLLPNVGPGARELTITESMPIAVISEGYGTPAANLPPILPPRHLVRDVESGLVCGVDDAGTLGCRVRAHGFVVTPTKTIVF